MGSPRRGVDPSRGKYDSYWMLSFWFFALPGSFFTTTLLFGGGTFAAICFAALGLALPILVIGGIALIVHFRDKREGYSEDKAIDDYLAARRSETFDLNEHKNQIDHD